MRNLASRYMPCYGMRISIRVTYRSQRTGDCAQNSSNHITKNTIYFPTTTYTCHTNRRERELQALYHGTFKNYACPQFEDCSAQNQRQHHQQINGYNKIPTGVSVFTTFGKHHGLASEKQNDSGF